MSSQEITQVAASGIQDDALVHLVFCANYGVGVGVTLIVGGQVIAGDLVSGQQYAEQAANNFRAAKAEEQVKDSLAKFFDNLAEDYRPDEATEIPLNYLHIKDPSYLSGDGHWVKFNGSIMRIFISNVDGFSQGKPDTAN
ncbi:hypothetical protein [Rosenbergiella epipactidis]|uniref:hypothetical protein n=1 Tax=Rosenbergiella epipactidis TaxID=1544694 RepID=UPI001F4D4118|nr:hypothetical protein [Rosenbergiella epipactidis]